MRHVHPLMRPVSSKRTRYSSSGIRDHKCTRAFTTWGLGITALIALGILEQLEAEGSVRPLDEMVHNSTEYLHTLIEALRFVDTLCSFFVPWLSWFIVTVLHLQVRCGHLNVFFNSNPEQIPCGTFRTQTRERYPSKNSMERYELIHHMRSQLLSQALLGVFGPTCKTL